MLRAACGFHNRPPLSHRVLASECEFLENELSPLSPPQPSLCSGSAPTGTHLCTPLSAGAGPAAPPRAFVNSGSGSCFQASINMQVLLPRERGSHSSSTCFQPGAVTRRTSKQLGDTGANVFLYLMKGRQRGQGAEIWLQPPGPKFTVSALTPLPLPLLQKGQQAGARVWDPSPSPGCVCTGTGPSLCLSLVLFTK